MDLTKIKALLDLFEESKISKIEVEDENLRILMEKGGEKVNYTLSEFPSTNIVERSENTLVENKEIVQESDNKFVKAPLVGTFYVAPSPDSSPFVNIGDVVEEGDILCIIEAMKMLNEIKSPVKGKLLKVIPKDGDLVGFDDSLFEIEEI